jgi:SHS2 domain-containing protein
MRSFDIAIDESNFSIQGTCKGGKFNPSKHVSGIIIKAVTYNMMEIKKNKEWRARVVLDV